MINNYYNVSLIILDGNINMKLDQKEIDCESDLIGNCDTDNTPLPIIKNKSIKVIIKPNYLYTNII